LLFCRTGRLLRFPFLRFALLWFPFGLTFVEIQWLGFPPCFPFGGVQLLWRPSYFPFGRIQLLWFSFGFTFIVIMLLIVVLLQGLLGLAFQCLELCEGRDGALADDIRSGSLRPAVASCRCAITATIPATIVRAVVMLAAMFPLPLPLFWRPLPLRLPAP
jgi:hypothetical protein